jgi:ATP-dependent DNA helicase UvrD/PcrA
MPLSGNRVIIACAGSGKTTQLVTEALASRDRRIAIVTYTNNNTREISNRFGKLNSGVPKYVDVMTWFSFLLRECARPYQRSKYAEKRIESLAFVNQQSARGIDESRTRLHYFANGDAIYSDKIAKFVVKSEEKSGQQATSRLRQIYTDVFIDEFQDLAGWDLDVVRMLLESEIRVTIVGDPRQHIYRTNPSRKNKQYLGIKVMNLVEKWQKDGLCSLEHVTATHRCSAAICDFSNALWPDMEAMTPLRNNATDHVGVFLVAETAVEEYIRRLNPQVLRYDKKAKTFGCEALNFGAAKGRQFERVLIVPTGPIKKYLRSSDLSCVEKAKAKLHVAVTRAFHSVAFVYDGSSSVVPNRWEPRRTGSNAEPPP